MGLNRRERKALELKMAELSRKERKHLKRRARASSPFPLAMYFVGKGAGRKGK